MLILISNPPFSLTEPTSAGQTPWLDPVPRPSRNLQALARNDLPGGKDKPHKPVGALRCRKVIGGNREWRKKEAEQREDEPIPARPRLQESAGRSRRARRRTSFSPNGMASISRRSPNGGGGILPLMRGWGRRTRPQACSTRTRKRSFSPTAGALDSRSTTVMRD